MPEPNRPLPHVAFATFCERIVQDKADDVLTVFRIYDAITVPAEAQGQGADLTVAIGLRSGDARGEYNIEFVLNPPPGGARIRLSPLPMQFAGDEAGATFGLQIRTPLGAAGLYWLDMVIEGHVLTRIPLRVIYEPQQAPRA